MTPRKPIVLVNGQYQQLQASDTLDATVSEQEILSLTDGESTSIAIGQAVYISAADTVKKALADASGTKDVIGLVAQASINASSSGIIKTSGVLSASTTQWDAVTGGSGGLTPNSRYYLDSSTAGKLTATAPTTAGQYVCPVGLAISTTEMKIDILQTILL